MNQIDLDGLHQRLALMMQEVHQICIENNIRYSMIGGTLIGALRHEGFIPWDDDIDIAMPWDDYKRFINIVFNNFNHPWLEFQLAGYTEKYYNPFLKAIDNRTTFVEGYEGENPKGIFIDIFPIVYAGDTKEEALKEFKRHRFLQSILKRKGFRFKTGVLREAMMRFYGNLHSTSYWVNKINEHYQKCNSYRKVFSSDMDGSEKGIVPTSFFESFQLYRFEDYEFMGVHEADEYMKMVFGDYMKLPPVEQRKPHHIQYMNLELPYNKYIITNHE